MPPRPEVLKAYVTKHYSNYKVTTAYEAGCCGYSAHRCFESYGWNSLVVNSADIFRPLQHQLCPMCKKGKLVTLTTFTARGPPGYWMKKLRKQSNK
ncbi:hypothetical protein GUB10_13715 [Salegentibacter sp. BLCTC]|uniref:hypothetical protein n=1 Tax=Salegentibacter sp. BLCTC TaxID=2697368 RepID=UPI00187B6D5A|nr:hypothetical protein [Salegentibacter sp. BLCTC]MBE7641392.1 hypothetical protein [Salegentibacter sp. BLCTC]